MEWEQQAQNMFSDWAASQQETWTRWLDAMQTLSGRPSLQVWRQTLEASRQAVRDMEKAQAHWRMQWQQGLDEAGDDPQLLREWATQGLAFMTRWEDAQRQMWDAWLAVFEQMAEQEQTGHGEAGEEIFKAWQDNVAQMTQAQMDWLARWQK